MPVLYYMFNTSTHILTDVPQLTQEPCLGPTPKEPQNKQTNYKTNNSTTTNTSFLFVLSRLQG